MSGSPFQTGFGVLIMFGGIVFALMAWSRSRGRIGQPLAIAGGSLLMGAWVAAPNLYTQGVDVATNGINWGIGLFTGSN